MEVKNISDREEYESILREQGYSNSKIVDMVKTAVNDEDKYPGIYIALEEGNLSEGEFEEYINEFINESIVPLVIGDSWDHEDEDVGDVVYNYLDDCDMSHFESLDSEYSGVARDYYDELERQWQEEQDDLEREYYRSVM